MRALLIAAVAALALSPVAALANANPDWAARIKRIADEVSIERDGALRPAKVGDRLAKDDVVVTGAGRYRLGGCDDVSVSFALDAFGGNGSFGRMHQPRAD